MTDKKNKTVNDKIIKELAALLEETKLNEIEYSEKDLKVKVVRYGASAMPMPVNCIAGNQALTPNTSIAPSETANHDNNPNAIKSPMVGVVYLSPEPNVPNFVKVGDTIKEGQTLCLIEAMKTFNPVTATKSGKVTSILIEDSTPVEFGEPLIIIE